ncbi:MAG: ABC transporter ATP-binding protein [Dehalococcoidia bacterium]|nr:MAG: ABC transporter ATP-binding protein [Dehalococcoidia bacterium]
MTSAPPRRANSAPPGQRAREWIRQLGRWLGLLGVAVLVILAPFVGLNNFWLMFLAALAISLVLTASLNLAMGYAGLVSMAHTGLFATGAYASGILAAKAGWPVWLSLPMGVVAAAVVGALMALATLRAAHLYFAMITFAFNLVLVEIAVEAVPLTGGLVGLLGVPRPRVGDLPLTIADYYLLTWALAGLALLFVRNVVDSRYGRAFIALRDGEDAAAALGIAPFRYKLLNFTLSAALAGLGGALFAHLNGFVHPALAGAEGSLNLFIALLLGGIGTLAGPLIGMVLVTLLQQLIAPLALYQALIFGAILLVAMMVVPAGLVGAWRQFAEARGWRREEALPSDEELPDPLAYLAAQPQEAVSAPIALTVRGLSKRFGGLQALHQVDLEVKAGTVHGLIGPNGSGKSTTVNCITGMYPPDAGEIIALGHLLHHPRPHRVAQLGVVRVFQLVHLFRQMTVLENVLVGLHLRARQSVLDALLRLPRFLQEEQQLRRQALAYLALVGLRDRALLPAARLSYGQQRLLELARALAANPHLLILDEPATGLTAEELRRVGTLIARLRAAGLPVLLIEHNMAFVMSLCDRISVLDHGEKIAEGPPEAIQRDPTVIEVYLGTSRGALSSALPAAPTPPPPSPAHPLLVVKDLTAGYGAVTALRGVSLEVRPGEFVVLLGANGAGKTTTLRTISGLLKPRHGTILFEGTPVHTLPPHRITARGVAHVPEGRQIFPNLTVLENLQLGGYLFRSQRALFQETLEQVIAIFPRLRERSHQLAGTLSGGEQQMLAIGRALMSRPRLLMLDEPSLGLAVKVVDELFAFLARLQREHQLAILLVEQQAALALSLAQRGYVLENGQVVLQGTAADLTAEERVQQVYLGGASVSA